ncbi:MAG: Gfo/Idh/MocA family oxidoreductase [Terriglobales bacterium]
MGAKRLGIAIVGSGFNAKFHLQAFVGVRDADVLGIWSPNRKHAEETAALARKLDVGEAKAFHSIAEMVANPAALGNLSPRVGFGAATHSAGPPSPAIIPPIFLAGRRRPCCALNPGSLVDVRRCGVVPRLFGHVHLRGLAFIPRSRPHRLQLR